MRTIVTAISLLVIVFGNIIGQQNPNALAFDGTNDFVSIGNISALKPTTNLTVEAKVYLASWKVSGTQTIISSSSAKGYSLKYVSGTLVASVYGNNIVNTASAGVSALTAGWHHVSFSFNGSIVRLYVDGTEKSNIGKNNATYTILYESNIGICLGTNGNGSGNFFMGSLDEVRIWNTTRTATQLNLANSKVEILPGTANLMAYYRFNKGTAGGTNAGVNSLTDLTSNSYNGTLSGFALTGTTSNWVSGYPLAPVNQASNVVYSKGTATSTTISWSRAGTNVGGNFVKVFVAATATGSATPVEGTSYTANTVFKSGTQVGTSGWYCVYSGTGTSVAVTGLTSGSTYRTHVIEYQTVSGINTLYNTATATNNPLNYYTVTASTQASNLSIASVNYTGFTASWKKGNGTATAVFIKEATTGTAAPVNGTAYTASTVYKSGAQIGTSGWYCISNGTTTSAIVTGLLPGKTYRVMLCEYNGSNGSEKYNVTTTTTSILNKATTDYTAPTTQSAVLNIKNISVSSFTANWTRGNGSKVVVFAKLASSGNPAPVNNTSYTANAAFGSGTQISTSGWFCVYNGTATSVNITGLTAGQTYRIVAMEYNGIALAEKYLTTVTSNSANGTPDYAAPTTAASNIIISGLSGNSFSASWTKGNGSNAAIFVKQTNTGTALPANNTNYTANANFASGSQIGTTGWYCVYNGNGNNVDISGLNLNSTYRIMVCEYNGTAGLEKYITSAATLNPVNATTLALTTWNGTSWSYGAPTSTTDALISGNYDISTNIICRDLTVNTGIILNIQASSSLTVYGNLLNNGSINLLSTTFTAPTGSLINYGTVTNNGTMKAERNFSPGTTESTNKQWHLTSIPVASVPVKNIFNLDYVTRYHENNNTWTNLTTGETLYAGEGYLVKTIKTDGKKVSYQGTFNNGNYSFNIVNTGPDALHGYNLIGNPYPSAIDWNSTAWTKQNVGTTIWVWDPINQRYMTWNGTVGQNGGSRYIQAMQAFFVKVNDNTATGSLTMTNNIRTHSSVSFQKSARVQPELLRLVTSGNDLGDELVLYKEDSENDITKFFSTNDNLPQLWAIDNEAVLSIYKVNSFAGEKIINLGFSCSKDGSYSISAKELSFPENWQVTLIDNLTHESVDLKTVKNYTFDYNTNDSQNRFSLKITEGNAATVAVANTTVSSIKIWGSRQNINIQPISAENATVEILNLEGKILLTKTIYGNSLQTISMQKGGFYIVRFESKEESAVKKILL